VIGAAKIKESNLKHNIAYLKHLSWSEAVLPSTAAVGGFAVFAR
jgi:hypothetical protein